MDEEYRKAIAGLVAAGNMHNSVWFSDGKVHSSICLAALNTNVTHLRWCIDRFSPGDAYQVKTLARSQDQDLSLQKKAAEEVIMGSFLSEVFTNRGEDFWTNGLIVDLSKPHAAIWAAMVQTRIFYEFPTTAEKYFELRKQGFSIDQSVFLCQKGLVGSHGTIKAWGCHNKFTLKKYFNRGWDYINSLNLKHKDTGSGGFSRKVFVQTETHPIEEVAEAELLDFLQGEKDV